MSKPDKLVLLGAVTGARGLKGEVILRVFTETPEAITTYGPLQSEDGAVTVEVQRISPVKAGFAAKLKGVNDRNAAEALKGIGLYATRAQLGEAEDEDEFFHTDLIGLDVERVDEGAEKGVIGRVKAVPNYGGGDLLEISLKGQKATVLVPFTREAVPVIDLDAGVVKVDPPTGLWDRGGKPDDGFEDKEQA